MQKFLGWEYSILLLLLPLLFYPGINYFPLPVAFLGWDLRTSELFELPKSYFVYLMTVVLGCTWGIGILNKQLQLSFKWTWVMVSYLGFIIFYAISSIFAIDKFSAIFGYPTRIHGGLLSYVCYAVITFIYIASNFSQAWRERHLLVMLWSSLGISIYAILQRFGIDEPLWNQDVQSRVFGTFGQPNWMAAYLSAMLPIGLCFAVRETQWRKKLWYLGILSSCLAAIIFSGSRSGLSGGLFAMLVVTACLGWSKNLQQRWHKRGLGIGVMIACLITGYWLWNNLWSRVDTMTIRLAVWEGAWQIFLKYPWVGSGPETFAFTFYENRPLALLRTAEWALLYNKAHNEVLHYLATIGILGTSAFGAYCLAMLYETRRGFLLGARSLNIYVCSGWWSLWIAHLFGFSVTATGLLLFLLPAFVNSEFREVKFAGKFERVWGFLGRTKTVVVTTMVVVCVYLGIELSGMIAADLAFANYKEQFRQGNISAAIAEIEKAVRLTPYNPWLQSELGWAYGSAVRILVAEGAAAEQLAYYEQGSLTSTAIARDISPMNTLFAQREILTYAYLYKKDEAKYTDVLYNKMNVLEKALPNEIALLAQWPKIYAEMGREEAAKALLERFLELKPDYQKGQEQLLELGSGKEN